MKKSFFKVNILKGGLETWGEWNRGGMAYIRKEIRLGLEGKIVQKRQERHRNEGTWQKTNFEEEERDFGLTSIFFLQELKRKKKSHPHYSTTISPPATILPGLFHEKIVTPSTLMTSFEWLHGRDPCAEPKNVPTPPMVQANINIMLLIFCFLAIKESHLKYAY